MNQQIIQKIFNIKSSTIDDMKDLLNQIKSYKDEKLAQRIKELEDELKEIQKAKKYGLVWEEKKEQFDKETVGKLPILEELKTKNIRENLQENNILIQGDNYHTLSVLNYTHAGKIDAIYIDPPYNTGNNDFIYRDKIVNDKYYDGSIVTKEDPFRHSKWLSFMNKRLKLAKNLLSEKGVIFISIDDNEFAQLKLLCDEVFGGENFIDIFSWNRTKTPANLSKKSRKVIEYIICYSKNINKNEGLLTFTSVSNSSNGLLGQSSKEKILIFPKNYVDTGLKNGIIKKGIYKSANYTIELLDDTEVKNGYFIKSVFLKGKFSWSQKKLNEEINIGTTISIRTLSFSPSYIRKEQLNKLPPKNLINEENNVGTSEDGSKIIRDIFGEIIFNFPKPPSLIKYLIGLNNNKNSTILDFFAGSGTTGHAVLELNKEDGGNRKFILATNNENNICEDVTYERLKRVITGYTNQKGEKVEGLGGNLTYLKNVFIDKSNVNDDLRTRMVARCSELLCLKENIWQPLETKTNEHIKIFQRHDKYLAILYDMFYFEEFKEVLKNLEKPISIYAFSHYKLTKSDFEEIKNIEIEQIPDSILEVYESIFGL